MNGMEHIELLPLNLATKPLPPIISDSVLRKYYLDGEVDLQGWSLDAPYLAPVESQHEKTGLDLVEHIKGLYRVIDLITEQGSGGLVDKMVISPRIRGLVETLSPGAFRHLTDIDLEALDQVIVKPLGIYGSKSEIVRYLKSYGAISDEVESMLLVPQAALEDASRPVLRPGIYAFLPPKQNLLMNGNDTTQDDSTLAPIIESDREGVAVNPAIMNARRISLIFWPEDTTWNDDAKAPVRRNRTTFMRYLTKASEQIVLMVSDEHLDKFVWNKSRLGAKSDMEKAEAEGEERDEQSDDEGDATRIFSFEVSQLEGVEKKITVRDGFSIRHPLLAYQPLGHKTITTKAGQLDTRFVSGDTAQALLTVQLVPKDVETKKLDRECTDRELREILLEPSTSLRFLSNVSRETLMQAITSGAVGAQYPESLAEWQTRQWAIESGLENDKRIGEKVIRNELVVHEKLLKKAVEGLLVNEILGVYPTLDKGKLHVLQNLYTRSLQEMTPEEYLKKLYQKHRDMQTIVQKTIARENFADIQDQQFLQLKDTILATKILLSQLSIDESDQQLRLANYLKDGQVEDAILLIDMFEPKKGTCDPIAKTIPRVWYSCTGKHVVRGSLKHAIEDAQNVPNDRFINQLDLISTEYPVLAQFAVEARAALYPPLKQKLHGMIASLAAKLEQTQALAVSNDIMRLLRMKRDRAQAYSDKALLEDLERAYSDETSARTLVVEGVATLSGYHTPDDAQLLQKNQFRIKGKLITRSNYRLIHSLLPLKVSEIDQHEMRINPGHIPKPIFKEEAKMKFGLALSEEIILIRLLERNRCLLVIRTDSNDIAIYVEDLPSLNHALQEGKHKRRFPQATIGEDLLCIYNEGCRRLIICNKKCAKHDLAIHSFLVDNEFATLKAQDLVQKTFEGEDDSSITVVLGLLCVPGEDAVAFVNESGIFGVLSFSSESERNKLDFGVQDSGNRLVETFGSPDGKMVFFVKQNSDGCVVESCPLGHTRSGDSVEIARLPSSTKRLQMQVSSINGRDNVYLLVADTTDGTLRSYSVGHADLSSNFYFREMQEKQKMLLKMQTTHHNSLLDCYYDVWTRFPITPPIQRQLQLYQELPKLLVFVASSHKTDFESYFCDLLDHFRNTTTKSSVQDVGKYEHFGCTLPQFVCGRHERETWKRVAANKAGHWLSNVFCLVPIHIAIAYNNQFIPIKNGIWNPEASAKVTGRKLDEVVDTLSFGWYESLFQSYKAQKAVKVVSSMGEQSVGKSFALNHFVDSTFAGSAMRTTEGVWMSVTPTPKCLVVALDFEGVHSLERTPTEDTLLVLFNAAISNLILFRNNYALSRDITGLLQSFQSSSTVLNPDDNPTLFDSKLMFIIKDVVDYDRDEIAKEFQLKLQTIVQKEQGTNFITKLHRGRVDIITWPVIESPDFYSMFKTLNVHLSDMQGHDMARNFVRVIKMLMAKLYLHDWGSLSSNMTMYKVKYLLSTLPNALAYGAAEIVPHMEPLKSIDTNTEVKFDSDTQSTLWVESLGERGNKLSTTDTLSNLCKLWPKYTERSSIRQDEQEWINGLSEHLVRLVDLRIQHVEMWVQENLQNCNQNSEEIRMLRVMLEAEYQKAKARVRLCKSECHDCKLACIGALYHEDPHSCGTDHRCALSCEFTNVHPGESRACNLRAGHIEKHVCNPKIHICGVGCSMKGLYGCNKICSKEIGHSDQEHVCSAPQHMCGKPCRLQAVATHQGSKYSCARLCIRPWDEEHETHVCELRNSCPIQCMLCRNTCATADHLHGLLEHAYHLCGQVHDCQERCASDGACRIDKSASGKTTTRQLRCTVQIPAGKTKHEGQHVHGAEEDLFHFCAHRCYCLEYCTLPYGHSQNDHEIEHSRFCIKNFKKGKKS